MIKKKFGSFSFKKKWNLYESMTLKKKGDHHRRVVWQVIDVTESQNQSPMDNYSHCKRISKNLKFSWSIWYLDVLFLLDRTCFSAISKTNVWQLHNLCITKEEFAKIFDQVLSSRIFSCRFCLKAYFVILTRNFT